MQTYKVPCPAYVEIGLNHWIECTAVGIDGRRVIVEIGDRKTRKCASYVAVRPRAAVEIRPNGRPLTSPYKWDGTPYGADACDYTGCNSVILTPQGWGVTESYPVEEVEGESSDSSYFVERFDLTGEQVETFDTFYATHAEAQAQALKLSHTVMTPETMVSGKTSIYNLDHPEWGTWGVGDRTEWRGSTWWNLQSSSQGAIVVYSTGLNRWALVESLA